MALVSIRRICVKSGLLIWKFGVIQRIVEKGKREISQIEMLVDWPYGETYKWYMYLWSDKRDQNEIEWIDNGLN